MGLSADSTFSSESLSSHTLFLRVVVFCLRLERTLQFEPKLCARGQLGHLHGRLGVGWSGKREALSAMSTIQM